MQVRCLASSSSGNCFAISDGQTPLLIEAGISFAAIQKGLGFTTATVAGCLISHSHADHARSAASLLRIGVGCYMSQETAEAIGLYGRHGVRVIEPLQQFRIGTWTILPWDGVHDVPCLGFLLVSDAGDRVLYATDTAYVPYRFRGLTVMLIECNHSLELLHQAVAEGRLHPALRHRLIRSHFSLERLLDLLQANDLSRLREIHLIHVSDDHGDEEGFRRAVMRATGCPVFVAQA